MERRTDVAILGAGTAGLSALGEVRKAGKDALVIDGGPLGTTCARVGCMPSKAFLQPADDVHHAAFFRHEGISGGDNIRASLPQVMQHVRELRDGFAGSVAERTRRTLGEKLISGYGRFREPTVIEVDDGTVVRADAVVVATGATPMVPDAWRQEFAEAILTTESFFEQQDLGQAIAVIGLGPVGLEIGQALHRLGIEVVGVDQLPAIGATGDDQVNRAATELVEAEFPLWLNARASLTRSADGRVQVAAGERSVTVDQVFVSMGRPPNIRGLDLDNLGVELDENGLPTVNEQSMQADTLPVFFAGDVTGQRPFLHEANHEGRIAGRNASRTPEPPEKHKRKISFSLTFCEPNIAQVGAKWSELRDRDDVVTGETSFADQARARIMGRNAGLIRVYGRRGDGRLLGAAMCAPRAENLAHLLVLAVQSELTVNELLTMPIYHPVLEEGLESALQELAKQVEK